MKFYNLTLQRATGITHAVHGNFSGTKQQEIAVSRGKILELLKLDLSTRKVHTLLAVEIFGVIRSMIGFRLADGSKDYLVVGSDSGRIVILEYNAQKNVLENVHQEIVGDSGCRRTVPGQFLAIDPQGRAVMISALEKHKLVYVLNRGRAGDRITISSALEAHKSCTFVYDTIGVDVGYKNPMFACLEMNYKNADKDPTTEAAQRTQQTLTFYELDLGLNHVVRKYSKLEEHGNFLISVPGGNDGPSGVLICSENSITYKKLGYEANIRCTIPRRRNDLDNPKRGVIFVCSATYKLKTMFFFLAQTEQGDIFKITLETKKEMVMEIKLKYFDTVAVASAMCILKTGFLFIASEFGNHFLYQIAYLGDNIDEPEFSSAINIEKGYQFVFAPRGLKNLILVDELKSLSPIMHCQIANLANEDAPQLYVACGRGPRSSLRVLRHGLKVSEIAVSELPDNSNAVWTIKRKSDEDFDAYIVMSFVNATLVLSIKEITKEVTDSGFLSTVPTLACAQIGDDALVQIYPEGIRHIKADKRVNEWRNQDNKTITKCAVNQRQIVIALAGGPLVYFEVDPMGRLNGYTDQKKVHSEVICMALASVPSVEERSRFLAVGFNNNTVCIISLDPSDYLRRLSYHSLPDKPESLVIVETGKGGGSRRGGQGTLYLNIGLQNGILLRTVLDQVTGDLSDIRTRHLGSEPVKLFKVRMQGNDAVVATSSRSWLSYYYQNRFYLTPLSYETLEYAFGYSSQQCPEGIVAISGDTLRILELKKLGDVFNQVATPIKYTPRKFVIHSESKYFIIIETDHNAYTVNTKMINKQQMAKEMVEATGDNEQEPAIERETAFLRENLPEDTFGAPKGGFGMWASLIRVLDPVEGETICEVSLEQNKAAFSICLVKFANQGDQQFLLIGLAKDMHPTSRHCNGGVVQTYLVLNEGRELEVVHETEVEDFPVAICAFRGKVLIGVGKILRIYDMGKKKLLSKCELSTNELNQIVTIHVVENRIIVYVEGSFFYVLYNHSENQLLIFANITSLFGITCATPLNCYTVAEANKFGDILVIRLPSAIIDEVEKDPTGVKSLWGKGGWQGDVPQMGDVIACFHVGEYVSSLQKATFIPGGSESLVYTTLSGSVGVLAPFTSDEDRDFSQRLEVYMRTENPPLCGRDHSAFRYSHFSTEYAIDGDLCEQFNSLDDHKQRAIAEHLNQNPREISKQLEDIRTKYAF